MWDTLETDDLDVIEYLKSIESNKSKLQTQVKNELKESEGDLLKIKMKPSNENNTNLLNVKTSALSKIHTNISVKGLCESADKCDNVTYNFCMTTYGQLKNISKKKQKIARTRISTIMLELESDSEY